MAINNIELVRSIAALCGKFGFIGFAGAFRMPDGEFHTTTLEASHCKDGVCVQIHEGLQAVVDTVCGSSTHISTESGIVLKDTVLRHLPNDEMPH